MPEAISAVTPALWCKVCDHTKKVKEEDWKKDGAVVVEILINVGSDNLDELSDEELEPYDDDDLQCLQLLFVLSCRRETTL